MRDHHFLLRLLSFAIAAASFWVATDLAAAQPKALGKGNELIASGSNAEFASDLVNPSVARDADGDYVVVWQGRGADSADIFARLFKRDGTPRGSAFEINQFVVGNQEQPDVAMTSTGDFVVVWESANQDGDSSGIYARLYRAGGIPFGDEFRVNVTTASHQRDPAVAIDAAGESIAVVYESFAVGDNKGEVFLRRLNGDGAGLGEEVRVNTFITDFQNHPDVAMAPDGSFVVAWESDDQNGADQHVYFRKFNVNGSAAGNEVEAHPGNSFQGSPRVAADARGEFLVVWGDSEGSFHGICGRVVSRTGDGSAGLVFDIRAATERAQLGVPTATGSAGDFVVAWSDRPPDSVIETVVARRFARDTGRTQVFVAKDVDLRTAPDIASDADGDFVVVNAARRKDRSHDDILGRRFGLAEVDLATELTLRLDKSGSLTPGSTLIYRANVENRNPQADLAIPFAYLDAIGVATGVRLIGRVEGNPKNPVLGLIKGRGWDCKKKSGARPPQYECERDASLPPTGIAPRIEIEVDAPKEPTTLRHIVRIVSDATDPKLDNNEAFVTTKIECKLRLSQSKFCVTESVGSRKITVNRVGQRCPRASVKFSARQDSALIGFDFARKEGTLSWAANDQEPKSVAVRILNDTAKESAEFFDFQLSGPVGTKIDGPSKASVRIVDDDPLPAGGCAAK
ncbi:MAG: Calx-beta domain-containing protein [Panacagrimonas sp.]